MAEHGHDDEAVTVLERLLSRAPLDPLAHWFLAERLWDAGRGREALDRAKLAVRLDPGFDPRVETALSAVLMWSDRLEVPAEASDLAAPGARPCRRPPRLDSTRPRAERPIRGQRGAGRA